MDMLLSHAAKHLLAVLPVRPALITPSQSLHLQMPPGEEAQQQHTLTAKHHWACMHEDR